MPKKEECTGDWNNITSTGRAWKKICSLLWNRIVPYHQHGCCSHCQMRSMTYFNFMYLKRTSLYIYTHTPMHVYIYIYIWIILGTRIWYIILLRRLHETAHLAKYIYIYNFMCINFNNIDNNNFIVLLTVYQKQASDSQSSSAILDLPRPTTPCASHYAFRAPLATPPVPHCASRAGVAVGACIYNIINETC